MTAASAPPGIGIIAESSNAIPRIPIDPKPIKDAFSVFNTSPRPSRKKFMLIISPYDLPTRASVCERDLRFAFGRSHPVEKPARDQKEHDRANDHAEYLEQMIPHPIDHPAHFVVKEKCQNPPEVIPDRSRDHDDERKPHRRIIQDTRRRDENFEGHWRRQQRRNDQRKYAPFSKQVFRPFEVLRFEPLEYELSATTRNAIEQKAADDRSDRRKEREIINFDGIVRNARYCNVIIDFG